MVGDDDAVDAVLDGQLGVLGGRDAFDPDLDFGAAGLFEPGDGFFPGERRVGCVRVEGYGSGGRDPFGAVVVAGNGVLLSGVVGGVFLGFEVGDFGVTTCIWVILQQTWMFVGSTMSPLVASQSDRGMGVNSSASISSLVNSLKKAASVR